MTAAVPPLSSHLWSCPDYVVFINSSRNATCAPGSPDIDLIKDGQAAILLPSLIYTAVLMALGLPGNLAVIFVYLFRMEKTPSRRFFISLAVCDFMNCSFGMPIELALLSNFYTFDYPTLCRISRFTNFFLNNTSSCLHIAIACDRYSRVRYPLNPVMTSRCFKVICLVSVCFSFTTAIPALFIYGTKTNAYEVPGHNFTFLLTKTCHVDDHADKTVRLTFSLYLLIATLLTFLVLMTLYGLITRVLLKRRDLITGNHGSAWHKETRRKSAISIPHFRRPSAPNTHVQNDVLEPFRDRTHSDLSGVVIHGIKIRVGRTTFILFIVTLVFVLSFIPHLIIVNLRYTNQHAFTDLTPLGWQLFHVALRSYLLNSSINPIIYCFLNSDFRKKVICMFKEGFFLCKNSNT